MLTKCMFSGSGGQGSALMAKLVCLASIKEGLKVVMTQTYGIEQRGGDSTAYVIVSDGPIGSPIVEKDATVAVALSKSIYDLCFEGTAPGGTLFCNTSLVEEPRAPEGFVQVGLGAVLARTGLLKLETVEQVLTETMGAKKPALLEMNIKALHTGYEAGLKG